ncbi:MAG TPA: branched-chain-amino-acid transaminase [Mariprofundaceae bacterium]|nr:branched-chain-amino-acid transaminase [Mariprofundaceae bacterium]
MNQHAICWMNGRTMPADEATVSVFDHGLLYGDGVFEGIRFYHGVPFRLAAHLQRLEDSARAIALMLPMPLPAIAAAVRQTVETFHEPEGYLRLAVTRGVGPLGINPENCHSPTLFIIADRLQMISPERRQQGARLIIASTRRLAPDGLDPRIKSLNYLNHILARMEANHAGADEALLLNAQGLVAEGTADNVFIARDGILMTPPVTDGALAGITRAAVIEIAAANGIKVQEKSIAPYDLYTADECFLTGTGAELIPVGSVDGRMMRQCRGPVFDRISQGFHELVKRECAALAEALS